MISNWIISTKCRKINYNSPHCVRSVHIVKQFYAKIDVNGNPIDQGEDYEIVWVYGTCSQEF